MKNGEIYDRESEERKVVIENIATRIKEKYHPGTVLVAGRGVGALVAALRRLKIEAYGVDASQDAIAQADEAVHLYCAAGSLADPLPASLPKRYDLVLSMGALTQMSKEDCEKAVSQLCAMTDRILFGFKPEEKQNPASVDQLNLLDWCGIFAEQGFFSDGEEDLAFLAGDVRCFQRKSVRAAVEGYERECQKKEDQVWHFSLIADELEEKNMLLEAERKEYQALYFEQQREYETLFQAYQATVTSFSWRLTKPMRVCLDGIKKVVKSNRTTHLVCKGIKGILRDGPAYTWKRVKQKIARDRKNKKAGEFDKRELEAQRHVVFPRQIKFSILVPLYNTPEPFLREMIASVQAQTYPNWELCMADGSDEAHADVGRIVAEYQSADPRIRYRKLNKNLGISGNTNACIEMATGEYIGLFDHDDLLHPAALYEDMKAICEQNADFIYTDELIFEGDIKNIVGDHYKPDFAIDNLRANNYICHFTVFHKDLLEQVGLFRSECDGSQDFDMVLRLTEKAKKIVHIPKALYFWRSHPLSVASNISAKPYVFEAAKKAIRDHLSRVGLEGEVSNPIHPSIYRVKYAVQGNPLISILIPNKDHISDLRKCILSIQEKSTYSNYEIIVIENNSTDEKTFQYYAQLERQRNIRVVRWDGPFNYSSINNYGYQFARGEYILLLNNNTEVISPDWIQEMLMFAQRDDVGAVGAKLYYPDNTIQHGGVVLGPGGVAAHLHGNRPRNDLGYMGRLIYAQDLTAVTAACMLIPRRVWEQTGGLDEGFAVAYNDVDLCMRIRQLGYLIVFTPFAELYHYEPKSRRKDDTPEKRARFIGEVERFQSKWKRQLEEGDPYYNPNFSLDDANFSIK